MPKRRLARQAAILPWPPPPATMKIEKGIPIPTAEPDIVAQMTVGDSIYATTSRDINHLRKAAVRHRKSQGWRFTSRKIGTGLRLWRIE